MLATPQLLTCTRSPFDCLPHFPSATYATQDEADLMADALNTSDPDWTYRAEPFRGRYGLKVRDEEGFDLGWL